MRTIFTVLLVLLAVSTVSVSSKSITNPNTLFDVQQAYGQKVQVKTAANKHLTFTSKHPLKAIKPNQPNLFRSKPFYNSKAALKQFQVQFKVGNSYNVQQFGAKGDGVTDDQAAINQAIARAAGTGLSVYFPPGNYLHSGLIVSNSVALFGVGASTILTATNNANGAIELIGNGPSLSNLVVQYANPAPATSNQPDTTPQAGAVWVQSANNFAVTQVTMLSSSQNDIDIFQSSNGNMSSNKIITTATMFDGIQIVDCINLQLLNNNFSCSGINSAIDEFFGAISSQNLNISYNQINVELSHNFSNAISINGLQCPQITHNIISVSSNGGFGIYVSGADGVQIEHNTVTNNMNGGGIQVWYSNDGIQLIGNTITSGNASTGIGVNFDDSVLISNNVLTCSASAGIDSDTVSSLQITNNVLAGTLGGGDISIARASNLQITNNLVTNCNFGIGVGPGDDATISSNVIDTTTADGIAVYKYANFTVQNNTLKNIGGNGILFNALGGSTTSATISTNSLSSCCISSGNVIDVEPNGGTVSALTIQNNTYAGPANNATYYIQSLVPGSATNPNISGNTQATALPNNLAP